MMQLKLSENIKSQRKAKGMTQEKLAELLNISSAAVSKWESNDTYPDITLIIPLARIFDISIDELMGYDAKKLESEINDVIKNYNELYKIGRYDEARDLIKNARKVYPNDYKIMDIYMWNIAGGTADNNPENLIKHSEEFMQISNTLLDNCTDESIRLNTINMKAKLLHAKGDTQGALEILKGFPSWYLSCEQKTEQLFAKDTPEFRYYIRKNMYELFDFACNKVIKTIWFSDNLSIDDKILKAQIFIDELITFSKNKGFEYMSYIASSTCAELCGKLSYLDSSDNLIINFREKQFDCAKVATIVTKTDMVLYDYIYNNCKTDNYLKWLINYYSNTELPTIKKLRENPKFIELLNKYQ